MIGEDVKLRIIQQVALIAPGLSETLQLVFTNLKTRVDLGSISGLFGLVFFVFLSSFVFKQLRYSFDVIYDDFDPDQSKSLLHLIKDRVGVMLIVLAMCLLFLASLLINPLFDYLLAARFKGTEWRTLVQIFLNLSILFVMFTGLYFFTPTRKKKLKDCTLMALISAIAFLGGNIVLGLYMGRIALNSLYGAAGALLIFLLWTFYSSLTVFMTVEVFQFSKNKR